MGYYLNPGNDIFKRALNSKIYIDKTELIGYTNSVMNTEQGFICVSRPRRFGKSMAANMISAYYDCECDSMELFRPYKIAKDASFKEHLNQYDVIFLDIQQILGEAGSVENLVDYLQNEVIAELKGVYEYIPQDEILLPKVLTSIYEKENPKKGFVFIIDEWDCIFREAKDNENVQKAYLDFLKGLFKGRKYVRLAYMTGILPIKKYGTHSALNIFYEYSMTNPKRLAEYVGFTEAEVKNLCKEFDMDFAEAQRWYDGYKFRRITHVYNPKSVVDAMTEGEFGSYWNNTETYEALQIYIDMNFDGLRDDVIIMLGGGRCTIDTEAFKNDMTTLESKDDVLTLLVHLGYLAYDQERDEVFIPNEEVRAEFVRVTKQSGWTEVVKTINTSAELLEATLQMDSNAVAKGIDAVHMETTSVLAYHNELSLSCVITLAYYSARAYYYPPIRELPAGKGFADVVFIPRKKTDKPALIVELKWDKSAEGAIDQIKNRQYVKALEEYGGDILLVGINYSQETKEHQCVIERYKK